jgi:hypothetical protein
VTSTVEYQGSSFDLPCLPVGSPGCRSTIHGDPLTGDVPRRVPGREFDAYAWLLDRHEGVLRGHGKQRTPPAQYAHRDRLAPEDCGDIDGSFGA